MENFRAVIAMANDVIQTGQICIATALRNHDLGNAEANVLMYLFGHGDGVRQDDIVAGVEVSKPAISRTVASLQRKGYVVRDRNEADRRAYSVRLTEKARAVEAFIHQQYADLVTAASTGVPPEKVREIALIFRQVIENMKRHRESLERGL